MLSIENKFRGYTPPPGKNLGGFLVENSPPLTSKFRGFWRKNFFARFARDRYHFHVRLEKVGLPRRFSAEELLLTHLLGKKNMEIAGAAQKI